MRHLYPFMTVLRRFSNKLWTFYQQCAVSIKSYGLFPALKALIHQAYYSNPDEYIKVHISTQYLVIVHIKNCQVQDRHKMATSDAPKPSFKAFMQDKHTLPMHILIDTDDVEFRVVSLAKSLPWDRFFLKRNIQRAEFKQGDVICTTHVPTPDDPHRYCFAALKSQSPILQSLHFFTQCLNPILSVQLNAVQQMTTALNRLSPNDTDNLSPWSVFIRKLSKTEWFMTAQYKGAILLSRYGFFPTTGGIDATDATLMLKEIKATQRYLQRYGFSEDNPISIISAGFDAPFTEADTMAEFIHIQNALTVPVRDLEMRMVLAKENPCTKIKAWVNSLTKPIFKTLYTNGFKPAFLLKQYYMYWTPIIALRIMAILSMLVITASVVTTFHLVKNQTSLRSLQQKTDEFSTIIGSLDRQQQAELFNFYSNQTNKDPIHFMQNLAKAIGRGARVLSLSWRTETKNDRDVPACDIIIELPKRLFQYRRKVMTPHVLTQYQNKVGAALVPKKDADITWTPQETKDNQINRIYKLSVLWH